MKLIGIVSLLLILATGCATSERNESAPEPQTHHLDLLAVQHDLDMDPPPSFVGYREKRFDACRMAPDLPNISDCSHAYFIQVGVQLSCRPSDDAENVTLSESELTPVANQDLRWRIGHASGEFRTDPSGFGMMLAITARSMKKQRLRISTGTDFLITRAGEATQIVTPTSWCR